MYKSEAHCVPNELEAYCCAEENSASEIRLVNKELNLSTLIIQSALLVARAIVTSMSVSTLQNLSMQLAIDLNETYA